MGLRGRCCAIVLFTPFTALFALALVAVFVPVPEVFVAAAAATTKGGAVRFVFGMLTDLCRPMLLGTFFLPIGAGTSVGLRADRPDQEEGERRHPETFLCHNETHVLVKNALQTNGAAANYPQAPA